MNKNNLANIKVFLKSLGVSRNAVFYKDLSELTTIGTGGRCLCYLNINNKYILIKFLEGIFEMGIRFYIIGGGSNIIFGDGIQDFIVVKLTGEFDYLKFIEGDLIKAGAGYNLQKFVVGLAKKNFDLSFLGGIPGTLGGAVIGNSGTADNSINEYVDSIEYISVSDRGVEKKFLGLEEDDIYYRYLQIEKPSIITDITFRADKRDSKVIIGKLRDRIKNKKRKQPLNTKNAGCFFKNPVNSDLKAGRLIDDCGLKGFSYGGAKVSEKHANFIENFSGSSSSDVFILSKIIRNMVEKKFNIKLEYEVEMVGLNER